MAVNDKFDINHDFANNLIMVVIRGLWTTDDFAVNALKMVSFVQQAPANGSISEATPILFDMRLSPVQTQETIWALYQYGKRSTALRKTATLVGSALQSIQLKRIGIPAETIFTQPNKAIEYLTS